MGKIMLTMQISLDGIVSDPDDWMTLNEQILADYLEYYKTVDTIVVGGNSYVSMAEYWQNAAKSSDSALERTVAKRLNELPKVVITHSEMDLIWENSSNLIANDHESFVHGIKELKKKAGNVSVESGVKTWQRLIQHDLVDDLWLLIHPVVVAQGERLFKTATNQFTMQLRDSKTYINGVVGLYYEK